MYVKFKLSITEKPQEEVSLGDLVGMMGSLMTAFVPEGEAQSKAKY